MDRDTAYKVLEMSHQKDRHAKHVTGRVNKKDLVSQVSALTGFKKKHVKTIVECLFSVMRSHLTNHRALTLFKIGTFTFKKQRGRKVIAKRNYRDDGSFTCETRNADPTCRLAFRPTAQMKVDSNWYPPEEIEEERRKEAEREQKFKQYLEEQK